MPNVSGRTGLYDGLIWGNIGCMYIEESATYAAGFGGGLQKFVCIDTSRISSEYKNNLYEVRIKSIISNGYIRLY